MVVFVIIIVYTQSCMKMCIIITKLQTWFIATIDIVWLNDAVKLY